MNVLTAVLFVLAHASLSSCRTQHSASHGASEPEVALVSPRKVPTLAQLMPILEGPDLPEVKLRKLRKLIPIYDELTRWRIDHNERLVELLPSYKKKPKPLAYILAGNDYMQLKNPDSEENNAKHDNKQQKLHKNDSDESTVSSKYDYRKRYKSYNERPPKKLTKSHTKSEYSRKSYKDENDKIYNQIHNSEFSHNKQNKKHKNNDNYKSEFNSNESKSEVNESSNENTESSSVTESSENKSIIDKNYSKEKIRANDGKSDRKEHKSSSQNKRPYKKPYRLSEYTKHSYKGKDDKKHNSREHSSERHNKKIYAKNKNIYSTNSGSYSKSESNESSNVDNQSWNKDTGPSSEVTEMWSNGTESKSIENASFEDKNESMEKTSHIHSKSNNSRQLETSNNFLIDDSAAQEAISRIASKGLLSSRLYLIPHSNISSGNSHSTKPDSLSDSDKRDSMSSKSEDNSLTANSESKITVISSNIKTVPESEKSLENVSTVHAVSLGSNVPYDSNVEFKADDDATGSHLSESVSESVSDESISNTEFNESRSEADSGIRSEVDSKTTEEIKELPNAHLGSIFPSESPSGKTIESISDISSESVTEFNISDLESNQSESSVQSTESESEFDSNYMHEATPDAELVSDFKSDASKYVTDENSSKSASVSNESASDSSEPESTSNAESASESISGVKSTSLSDENSKYESKESVSIVSDLNSSGFDSISDSESVPDGVYNVTLKEHDNVSTERSNEFIESESTSEANSKSVSVSYDGKESTSDLKSKKYSNEEKNESTSTNSDESKSNIADFSESGLKSNSDFELTDFYKPYENVETESQSGGIMEVGKALISNENDYVGNLDMTEKSYEKLSHESRFDNDDEMMIENKFGVFMSGNDVVHEESTKHNKDGHLVKAHGKHVSDDNSSFDIKSADTSHDASNEDIDKQKQDSTRKTEREDLVEVITVNEDTGKFDNNEETLYVPLVKKHHHHHHVHDTETLKHNKYDVGDVSSDVVQHQSVAIPIVLEDYENGDGNTVISTNHEKLREFTPINIVIKKNDDKDAITKNIFIKYDTSREDDIIIDARTDKEQDDDLNSHENHRDGAKHHHSDVNTHTKQHNNTTKLGTNQNVECDIPNNKVSVASKEKHHHKTYKLSFIFN